ncbi:MAG: bifunctional heptose 7-phosphate kinase/heptose 1-phosphate adenyltransferase [Chitinivibrionales bacterium]
MNEYVYAGIEMVDYKIEAIRRFGDLKVVVLGDVMMDIYDFCYTSQSRPSPEKPGKRVYTAHTSMKALGGAGNVAANLSALGVRTTLIGLTGNDGHYFTLQKLADRSGIEHCLIRDRSRPTTMKTRLYIDDEYVLRRDDEATHRVSRETAATIFNEFLSELDQANAVIISDYNKGFFSPDIAQKVINASSERRIPVVVDFKPANRDLFRGADIIAPNNHEAAALLPGFHRDGDLEQQARQLFELLQCKNLIVTLGAEGMCGFDGKQFFVAPAHTVDEVDAVGCGDTVRVVLALTYALGNTLLQSAELANDAAAVVLQKKGTATVSRDELTAFIQGTAVRDCRKK